MAMSSLSTKEEPSSMLKEKIMMAVFELRLRVMAVVRDGNQGPGPRVWPVKTCCGGGLGLHLINPQNCGSRGLGFKKRTPPSPWRVAKCSGVYTALTPKGQARHTWRSLLSALLLFISR
ncbi:hypothetical protein Rs2_09320 [Raphanus sativus]|nr:hypothetical protein Rs2_09320 [Raphanus sativus]